MRQWGNKKAKAYWMSEYNKTLYPVPDRSNSVKMKEFMRLKYEQKRFMTSDARGEDSDSPKPKKKKRRKREESSEEDKEEESDASEEEKPQRFRKVKKKKPTKLAPPEPKEEKPKKKRKKKVVVVESESSEEEEEEAPPPKKKKTKKEPIIETPLIDPVEEQRKQTESLLDMDFGSAPMPPSQPEPSPEKQQQESLFDAFENSGPAETPAISAPDPNQQKAKEDLMSHLGDLYAQSKPPNPYANAGFPTQVESASSNPFASFQAPAQAPPAQSTNPFGQFSSP